MSVASSLAYFVRDDALVDAPVGVAHRADDQVVHIMNCKRKQTGELKFEDKEQVWIFYLFVMI